MPAVDLAPRLLLSANVLTFEITIRPPFLTRSIRHDSFREELITIGGERLNVDWADPHWPEASSACLVLEVGCSIRCSDEHARPRFDAFFTAVGRAIAFELGGTGKI